MLVRFFIFSWWIWFFTFLYFLTIIPYSLLYASFIAVIFTFFVFLFDNNIHYTKRLFIFFFELFILLVNARLHFIVDKKPLTSVNDILFNILLFLIYLIVLHINSRTFYEIYFIDVKKTHYNNTNFIEFIKILLNIK